MSDTNFNFAHMTAYANGALDGYNCGVENSPYDTEDLHYCYTCGYEYGVHLYCQDNHPEDYDEPPTTM